MRSALQTATAQAHEGLDRRLAIFDIGVADEYARFLTAIADALIPLEQLLDRNGAQVLLPDWPARRRSDAVAQDIADLGRAVSGATIERTRVAPAFAWGMLYTLEGSRLGSRVLLDRVAGNEVPTRYLAHGDGSMWRRFCLALEASVVTDSDVQEAAAGALYAFEVFERSAQRMTGSR